MARIYPSIGDGGLVDSADTVVSVPEILNHWLQARRIDVGFLGAAPIERLHVWTSVPRPGQTSRHGRLGVLHRDSGEEEVVLTPVHPDVGLDRARAVTGRPLRTADPATVTGAPSPAERDVLRAATGDTAG